MNTYVWNINKLVNSEKYLDIWIKLISEQIIKFIQFVIVSLYSNTESWIFLVLIVYIIHYVNLNRSCFKIRIIQLYYNNIKKILFNKKCSSLRFILQFWSSKLHHSIQLFVFFSNFLSSTLTAIWPCSWVSPTRWRQMPYHRRMAESCITPCLGRRHRPDPGIGR